MERHADGYDGEWHVYEIVRQRAEVGLTESPWKIVHEAQAGEFLDYGNYELLEFQGTYDTYEAAVAAVDVLENKRRVS